ncbi:MAG: putative quinol monooxygenase [Spirochaetia bacterium]
MIVRVITCRVKPGSEAAFEEATAVNRRGSIAESGVLRFDILKATDELGVYCLYEVYRDHAATVKHKETDHYKLWRETVANHMAADRASVTCSVIAPVAESDW